MAQRTVKVPCFVSSPPEAQGRGGGTGQRIPASQSTAGRLPVATRHESPRKPPSTPGTSPQRASDRFTAPPPPGSEGPDSTQPSTVHTRAPSPLAAGRMESVSATSTIAVGAAAAVTTTTPLAAAQPPPSTFVDMLSLSDAASEHSRPASPRGGPKAPVPLTLPPPAPRAGGAVAASGCLGSVSPEAAAASAFASPQQVRGRVQPQPHGPLREGTRPQETPVSPEWFKDAQARSERGGGAGRGGRDGGQSVSMFMTVLSPVPRRPGAEDEADGANTNSNSNDNGNMEGAAGINAAGASSRYISPSRRQRPRAASTSQSDAPPPPRAPGSPSLTLLSPAAVAAATRKAVAAGSTRRKETRGISPRDRERPPRGAGATTPPARRPSLSLSLLPDDRIQAIARAHSRERKRVTWDGGVDRDGVDVRGAPRPHDTTATPQPRQAMQQPLHDTTPAQGVMLSPPPPPPERGGLELRSGGGGAGIADPGRQSPSPPARTHDADGTATPRMSPPPPASHGVPTAAPEGATGRRAHHAADAPSPYISPPRPPSPAGAAAPQVQHPPLSRSPSPPSSKGEGAVALGASRGSVSGSPPARGRRTLSPVRPDGDGGELSPRQSRLESPPPPSTAVDTYEFVDNDGDGDGGAGGLGEGSLLSGVVAEKTPPARPRPAAVRMSPPVPVMPSAEGGGPRRVPSTSPPPPPPPPQATSPHAGGGGGGPGAAAAFLPVSALLASAAQPSPSRALPPAQQVVMDNNTVQHLPIVQHLLSSVAELRRELHEAHAQRTGTATPADDTAAAIDALTQRCSAAEAQADAATRAVHGLQERVGRLETERAAAQHQHARDSSTADANAAAQIAGLEQEIAAMAAATRAEAARVVDVERKLLELLSRDADRASVHPQPQPQHRETAPGVSPPTDADSDGDGVPFRGDGAFAAPGVDVDEMQADIQRLQQQVKELEVAVETTGTSNVNNNTNNDAMPLPPLGAADAVGAIVARVEDLEATQRATDARVREERAAIMQQQGAIAELERAVVRLSSSGAGGTPLEVPATEATAAAAAAETHDATRSNMHTALGRLQDMIVEEVDVRSKAIGVLHAELRRVSSAAGAGLTRAVAERVATLETTLSSLQSTPRHPHKSFAPVPPSATPSSHAHAGPAAPAPAGDATPSAGASADDCYNDYSFSLDDELPPPSPTAADVAGGGAPAGSFRSLPSSLPAVFLAASRDPQLRPSVPSAEAAADDGDHSIRTLAQQLSTLAAKVARMEDPCGARGGGDFVDDTMPLAPTSRIVPAAAVGGYDTDATAASGRGAVATTASSQATRGVPPAPPVSIAGGGSGEAGTQSLVSTPSVAPLTQQRAGGAPAAAVPPSDPSTHPQFESSTAAGADDTYSGRLHTTLVDFEAQIGAVQDSVHTLTLQHHDVVATVGALQADLLHMSGNLSGLYRTESTSPDAHTTATAAELSTSIAALQEDLASVALRQERMLQASRAATATATSTAAPGQVDAQVAALQSSIHSLSQQQQSVILAVEELQKQTPVGTPAAGPADTAAKTSGDDAALLTVLQAQVEAIADRLADMEGREVEEDREGRVRIADVHAAVQALGSKHKEVGAAVDAAAGRVATCEALAHDVERDVEELKALVVAVRTQLETHVARAPHVAIDAEGSADARIHALQAAVHALTLQVQGVVGGLGALDERARAQEAAATLRGSGSTVDAGGFGHSGSFITRHAELAALGAEADDTRITALQMAVHDLLQQHQDVVATVGALQEACSVGTTTRQRLPDDDIEATLVELRVGYAELLRAHTTREEQVAPEAATTTPVEADARMAGVEASLEELVVELQDVARAVREVQSAHATTRDGVDDVARTLAAVEGRVAWLGSQQGETIDSAIATASSDVDARLAALQTSLHDLAARQQQILSTVSCADEGGASALPLLASAQAGTSRAADASVASLRTDVAALTDRHDTGVAAAAHTRDVVAALGVRVAQLEGALHVVVVQRDAAGTASAAAASSAVGDGVAAPVDPASAASEAERPTPPPSLSPPPRDAGRASRVLWSVAALQAAGSPTGAAGVGTDADASRTTSALSSTVPTPFDSDASAETSQSQVAVSTSTVSEFAGTAVTAVPMLGGSEHEDGGITVHAVHERVEQVVQEYVAAEARMEAMLVDARRAAGAAEATARRVEERAQAQAQAAPRGSSPGLPPRPPAWQASSNDVHEPAAAPVEATHAAAPAPTRKEEDQSKMGGIESPVILAASAWTMVMSPALDSAGPATAGDPHHHLVAPAPAAAAALDGIAERVAALEAALTAVRVLPDSGKCDEGGGEAPSLVGSAPVSASGPTSAAAFSDEPRGGSVEEMPSSAAHVTYIPLDVGGGAEGADVEGVSTATSDAATPAASVTQPGSYAYAAGPATETDRRLGVLESQFVSLAQRFNHEMQVRRFTEGAMASAVDGGSLAPPTSPVTLNANASNQRLGVAQPPSQRLGAYTEAPPSAAAVSGGPSSHPPLLSSPAVPPPMHPAGGTAALPATPLQSRGAATGEGAGGASSYVPLFADITAAAGGGGGGAAGADDTTSTANDPSEDTQCRGGHTAAVDTAPATDTDGAVALRLARIEHAVSQLVAGGGACRLPSPSPGQESAATALPPVPATRSNSSPSSPGGDPSGAGDGGGGGGGGGMPPPHHTRPDPPPPAPFEHLDVLASLVNTQALVLDAHAGRVDALEARVLQAPDGGPPAAGAERNGGGVHRGCRNDTEAVDSRRVSPSRHGGGGRTSAPTPSPRPRTLQTAMFAGPTGPAGRGCFEPLPHRTATTTTRVPSSATHAAAAAGVYVDAAAADGGDGRVVDVASRPAPPYSPASWTTAVIDDHFVQRQREFGHGVSFVVERRSCGSRVAATTVTCPSTATAETATGPQVLRIGDISPYRAPGVGGGDGAGAGAAAASATEMFYNNHGSNVSATAAASRAAPALPALLGLLNAQSWALTELGGRVAQLDGGDGGGGGGGPSTPPPADVRARELLAGAGPIVYDVDAALRSDCHDSNIDRADDDGKHTIPHALWAAVWRAVRVNSTAVVAQRARMAVAEARVAAAAGAQEDAQSLLDVALQRQAEQAATLAEVEGGMHELRAQQAQMQQALATPVRPDDDDAKTADLHDARERLVALERTVAAAAERVADLQERQTQQTRMSPPPDNESRLLVDAVERLRALEKRVSDTVGDVALVQHTQREQELAAPRIEDGVHALQRVAAVEDALAAALGRVVRAEDHAATAERVADLAAVVTSALTSVAARQRAAADAFTDLRSRFEAAQLLGETVLGTLRGHTPRGLPASPAASTTRRRGGGKRAAAGDGPQPVAAGDAQTTAAATPSMAKLRALVAELDAAIEERELHAGDGGGVRGVPVPAPPPAMLSPLSPASAGLTTPPRGRASPVPPLPLPVALPPEAQGQGAHASVHRAGHPSDGVGLRILNDLASVKDAVDACVQRLTDVEQALALTRGDAREDNTTDATDAPGTGTAPTRGDAPLARDALHADVDGLRSEVAELTRWLKGGGRPPPQPSPASPSGLLLAQTEPREAGYTEDRPVRRARMAGAAAAAMPMPPSAVVFDAGRLEAGEPWGEGMGYGRTRAAGVGVVAVPDLCHATPPAAAVFHDDLLTRVDRLARVVDAHADHLRRIDEHAHVPHTAPHAPITPAALLDELEVVKQAVTQLQLHALNPQGTHTAARGAAGGGANQPIFEHLKKMQRTLVDAYAERFGALEEQVARLRGAQGDVSRDVVALQHELGVGVGGGMSPRDRDALRAVADAQNARIAAVEAGVEGLVKAVHGGGGADDALEAHGKDVAALRASVEALREHRRLRSPSPPPPHIRDLPGTLERISEILAAQEAQMGSVRADLTAVAKNVAPHTEAIDALRGDVVALQAEQTRVPPVQSPGRSRSPPPGSLDLAELRALLDSTNARVHGIETAVMNMRAAAGATESTSPTSPPQQQPRGASRSVSPSRTAGGTGTTAAATPAQPPAAGARTASPPRSARGYADAHTNAVEAPGGALPLRVALLERKALQLREDVSEGLAGVLHDVLGRVAALEDGRVDRVPPPHVIARIEDPPAAADRLASIEAAVAALRSDAVRPVPEAARDPAIHSSLMNVVARLCAVEADCQMLRGASRAAALPAAAVPVGAAGNGRRGDGAASAGVSNRELESLQKELRALAQWVGEHQKETLTWRDDLMQRVHAQITDLQRVVNEMHDRARSVSVRDATRSRSRTAPSSPTEYVPATTGLSAFATAPPAAAFVRVQSMGIPPAAGRERDENAATKTMTTLRTQPSDNSTVLNALDILQKHVSWLDVGGDGPAADARAAAATRVDSVASAATALPLLREESLTSLAAAVRAMSGDIASYPADLRERYHEVSRRVEVLGALSTAGGDASPAAQDGGVGGPRGTIPFEDLAPVVRQMFALEAEVVQLHNDLLTVQLARLDRKVAELETREAARVREGLDDAPASFVPATTTADRLRVDALAADYDALKSRLDLIQAARDGDAARQAVAALTRDRDGDAMAALERRVCSVEAAVEGAEVRERDAAAAVSALRGDIERRVDAVLAEERAAGELRWSDVDALAARVERVEALGSALRSSDPAAAALASRGVVLLGDESQGPAGPAAQVVELEALAARLAGLEQERANPHTPTATGDDVTTLAARVDDIAGRLARVEETAQEEAVVAAARAVAPPHPDVAGIHAALARLESHVADVRSDGDARMAGIAADTERRTAELAARLARVEVESAAAAASTAVAAVEAACTAQSAEIDAVRTRVAAIEGTSVADPVRLREAVNVQLAAVAAEQRELAARVGDLAAMFEARKDLQAALGEHAAEMRDVVARLRRLEDRPEAHLRQPSSPSSSSAAVPVDVADLQWVPRVAALEAAFDAHKEAAHAKDTSSTREHADMNREVRALAARVAECAYGDDVRALAEKHRVLAEEGVSESLARALDPVYQKLGSAEARLDAAERTAAGPGGPEAPDTLRMRLEVLEATKGGDDSAAIAKLEASLAEVAQRVALRDAATTQRVDRLADTIHATAAKVDAHAAATDGIQDTLLTDLAARAEAAREDAQRSMREVEAAMQARLASMEREATEEASRMTRVAAALEEQRGTLTRIQTEVASVGDAVAAVRGTAGDAVGLSQTQRERQQESERQVADLVARVDAVAARQRVQGDDLVEIRASVHDSGRRIDAVEADARAAVARESREVRRQHEQDLKRGLAPVHDRVRSVEAAAERARDDAAAQEGAVHRVTEEQRELAARVAQIEADDGMRRKPQELAVEMLKKQTQALERDVEHLRTTAGGGGADGLELRKEMQQRVDTAVADITHALEEVRSQTTADMAALKRSMFEVDTLAQAVRDSARDDVEGVKASIAICQSRVGDTERDIREMRAGSRRGSAQGLASTSSAEGPPTAADITRIEDTHRRATDTLTTRIDSLERRLARLHDDAADARGVSASARDAVESSSTTTTARLEELATAVHTAQLRIREHDDGMDGMAAAVAGCQAQIAGLERDLRSVRKVAMSGGSDTSASEHQRVHAALAKQERHLERLEREVGEVRAAAVESRRLQRDVDALRDTVAALQAGGVPAGGVDTLRARVVDLEARVAGVTRDAVDKLSRALASTKDDVQGVGENLQKVADQFASQVRKLQRDINALSITCKEQWEAIDKAAADVKQERSVSSAVSPMLPHVAPPTWERRGSTPSVHSTSSTPRVITTILSTNPPNKK